MTGDRREEGGGEKWGREREREGREREREREKERSYYMYTVVTHNAIQT